MLELKGVNKIYKTKAGDTHALKDVDLIFQESGMVFINGKSGSGKTTLLNVIGGLDSVDGGEIVVDGKSFDSFTTAEYDAYRNTYVGFIFQEYNLLSDFSVGKNVEIATELQGRKVGKADIQELLESFEIGEYIERDPSQLSGGQKQRVAIARALIKNPRIIIADEPTGALDSQTGKQVIELLKKLSSQTLVIVVSHDNELAKNYADRIISLKDGRVVSDVTIKEVDLNTAVYKTETGVIVKSRADLTEEETKCLVQAVKDGDNIELTDKISVREESNTDQNAFPRTEKQVNLVNSKMKLKSAALLGFKFLKVKPLRLVFTVLLSMVAFSVFGLFATVASYTQAKAMADIIYSSEFNGIALSGQYNIDQSIGYDIKISQQDIDAVNKETGFNFRGIYDINDKALSGNKNREIFELYDCSISTGKSYYYKTLNGFIEFKKSEITKTSNDKEIIDKNGFNCKVVAGKYPTETNQVAISEYTAQCILQYVKSKENTYAGNKVYLAEDLIDKTISFYSPAKTFKISGIIDCGEVPSDYNSLKTVTYTSNANLVNDLYAYLNNGLFMSLFVGEGFTANYMAENNRTTQYSATHATYNIAYSNQDGGFASKIGNSAFYKSSTIDKEKLLLINNDDKENFQLKSGEAIVALYNLEYLYRNEKINANLDDQEKLNEYWNVMTSALSNVAQKQKALNDYLTLNAKLAGQSGVVEKTMSITQVETVSGKRTTLNLKVVGVYFDVNTDLSSNVSWLPIMLTESDLNTFNVYTRQGDYSRIVSPTSASKRACKVLAEYATKDVGLSFTIFENEIYELLQEGEKVINQVSDLFLYVSMVMAIFSVLMLLNYISSSIVAKRQTIGVLKGLGASKRDVFRTFIIEGLILSFVIGILSIGLSYFGCYLVNIYVKKVMQISLKIAIFELPQAGIIVLSSVLTGIISSIFPILKITKESPVKLIRNN